MTPLSMFFSGEIVNIINEQQKSLGFGMINPQSLIAVRVLDNKKPLGKSLLKERIDSAFKLRSRYYAKPFYRLLYAEGDRLPGLIIDRYGDIAVVQITSAGLVPFVKDLISLLLDTFSFRGVVIRNDNKARQLEGLSDSGVQCFGEVPESIVIEENHCQFLIPLREGQKTGWFYDHRENRKAVLNFSREGEVLDVFSYIGAWGIACLKHGAKQLTAVDGSERALSFLQKSAALNGVEDQVEVMHKDAFEALNLLVSAKRKFDLVIVDPPAFIKKKKDLHNGIKAYERINELALRLVKRQGFLLSASCSMHLPSEKLQSIVQARARHVDRYVKRVFQGSHAVDHPVHPAIKETEYLKAQLYQVQ